jgi:hypothetical protein
MTTTAPPPARCGFCRRRLNPDGPSQSFCDSRCQADWHATRNTRPLATPSAAPVAEPEPAKAQPEPLTWAEVDRTMADVNQQIQQLRARASAGDPEPEPVDELHAWVRQLGPPLRPAAPIPPTPEPGWAARLADRCRAIWARDRQETRTP